ncbi:MAG: fructosamine kinase family protein [Gammaproteobacteria bacterium]
MTIWNHIARAIADATGTPFAPSSPASVGGGCINRAYRLADGARSYFVKINDASGLDMFEAEAAGLEAMAAARAIRVPRPVTVGTAERSAYLVLEYISLGGRGDPRVMGEQLAAMHRVTSTRFGWGRDNTIGSTPQVNTPADDWVAFWRAQRLGFQLNLAGRNGIGARVLERGERLMAEMDALFQDHQPEASLLHGDLWGGNAAADEQGNPVIFDPATYFGDRETDIAMTELFGGFGRGFYDAYNAAWPLDAGYGVRKTFYNLYHILNHYNLFGGGYGSQAEGMIQQLLAELR